MGKSFRDTLDEQLKRPEFKAEWDAMEPERQIMKAMVKARVEHDFTQKQLSTVTGIAQADISRLENCTANPSLKTLKRLAVGLGRVLKISFVLKDENSSEDVENTRDMLWEALRRNLSTELYAQISQKAGDDNIAVEQLVQDALKEYLSPAPCVMMVFPELAYKANISSSKKRCEESRYSQKSIRILA